MAKAECPLNNGEGIEGIRLINGLQMLPKLDGLQMNYVITAAWQLRITSLSDGLPAAPTRLPHRLKSALARLELVRDADDRAIINDFVRKNFPEADY